MPFAAGLGLATRVGGFLGLFERGSHFLGKIPWCCSRTSFKTVRRRRGLPAQARALSRRRSFHEPSWRSNELTHEGPMSSNNVRFANGNLGSQMGSFSQQSEPVEMTVSRKQSQSDIDAAACLIIYMVLVRRVLD